MSDCGRAAMRCRQSGATLVIAKLDRLGRRAAFLHGLKDSGVPFVALDIPEANTLTLGVMIAMAQHEREMISSRTRSALQARRARGLPMGKPRDLSVYQAVASAKGGKTMQDKARARAAVIAPAIEAARAAGHMSLRQIAAYLNDQSIQTPRGKSWTATAVRNTLALFGAAK